MFGGVFVDVFVGVFVVGESATSVTVKDIAFGMDSQIDISVHVASVCWA